MKKTILPTLGAALAAAVFSSCGSSAGNVKINYAVGECNRDLPFEDLSQWAGADVTVEEGRVIVHQRISYVCCAEIKIEADLEGNVIRVTEKNTGDVCKCICGYEADFEIAGLAPGHYALQIWGVEHKDLHSLELLHEEEIDL